MSAFDYVRGPGLQKRERSGKGKYIDPLSKEQRRLADKLARHFPSREFDITRRGLYTQGYDYLKDLLSNDPQAMKSFEAPFLRQFNEQIVPAISERFAGLGEGAWQSSGFQNALAQQASSLQERLAAMRSGLQFQALPQALEFLQAPVQNAYNKASLALGLPGLNYMPPTPTQGGFWQNFSSGLGQGIGQLGPYAALAMI